MYIAFVTLWIGANGLIMIQPYKKAVDSCLWANRVNGNSPVVIAIGFEISEKPTIHIQRINCENAKEIDKDIKFGERNL